MSVWQTIDTAPKDGTKVYVRRVFHDHIIYEGSATWRRVTFPDTQPHPLTGEVDRGFDAEGWMDPNIDKRVPEPTHWLPST